MGYPPEIEALHRTLSSLAGVHGVGSGIDDLQRVSAAELGAPGFAHLPHGALRRAAAEGPEALIQVEFLLEPGASGWRSLEFLAWFVRDQARGGEALQLRPFALPPVAGDLVQLGSTLRFHLDIFCPGAGANLSPEFERVARLTEGLALAIEFYDALLTRHGAPGLRPPDA